MRPSSVEQIRLASAHRRRRSRRGWSAEDQRYDARACETAGDARSRTGSYKVNAVTGSIASLPADHGRRRPLGRRPATAVIAFAAMVALIGLVSTAGGATPPSGNEALVQTPNIFAPTSTPAFAIRDLSWLVLSICAVIFVVVAGVLASSLIRFRRRPDVGARVRCLSPACRLAGRTDAQPTASRHHV